MSDVALMDAPAPPEGFQLETPAATAAPMAAPTPPAGFQLESPAPTPAPNTLTPTQNTFINRPGARYPIAPDNPPPPTLAEALAREKHEAETSEKHVTPEQIDKLHPAKLYPGLVSKATPQYEGQPMEPLSPDEQMTLYKAYRNYNAANRSAAGAKQAATAIDPSVLRADQESKGALGAMASEAVAALRQSPLARAPMEAYQHATGQGDWNAIEGQFNIQAQQSQAAHETHPYAAPVGAGVGFMLRPEVATTTVATGGVAGPLAQGANLGTRLAIGAGAAGTSMGGIQTFDQALAGEPVTPVKNFAVNAAGGLAGAAGGELVGGVLSKAFVQANPGKAAAIKFISGMGTAGGVQAGMGAAQGQTSPDQIIGNILAGASQHVAFGGAELVGELRAARETLTQAPPNPEVDAAIARISRYEAALGKRDDMQGRQLTEPIGPPKPPPGFELEPSTPERAAATVPPPVPATSETGDTHASTVRSDQEQVRAEHAVASGENKGIENLQRPAEKETGDAQAVQQARPPQDVQAPAAAAETVADAARPAPTPKEPWQMTRAEYTALTNDETVSSAASRTDKGRIVEAAIHPMVRLKEGESVTDEGFTTSKGRYVSRTEAAMLSGGNYWQAVADGSQDGSSEGVMAQPDAENPRRPKQADAFHAQAVKDALASGKPVPPEVLKDYPELNPPAESVGPSKAVSGAGAGERPKAVETPQAEAKPDNKPTQSVGAAHPASGEFEDPVAMGIKNAETDKLREEQGLPPRVKDAPLTNNQAWDEAIQRHIADPLASEKLSKELLASPRAVTPQEDALLTQRMIWLKNQKRAVMEEINGGRSDAAIAFRLNDLNQAIADHIIMAEKVGRASGQSLQARKMMGNEGFALTKSDMEDTARAAKKAATGEDLTKAELATVQEQADKVDAATKALEKRAAEVEDKERTKRLDEAQEAAKIKVAREELQDSQKDQADVDPRTRSIVNRITDYLDKISDAAEARIRARGAVVMAGLDPANLADYTIVGSAQIAKGFLKLSEWSAVMVKKFGEGIKPHLETIYDASSKHVDKVVEKFAGPDFEKQAKGLLKTKPGTRDIAAEKKDTVQGLKDAVANGAKGYDLARWLKALQEKFIAGGITERGKTLDAVHDVVKGVIPDMTRRETADALSGYGDYKPLSKDEVKVTARQQRGELQALSKLQDVLEKNQAPLKSGVERQEPTDETRRTLKQVNDEMRKRGIQAQSPEMQLKSTLDAIHTRLQHEISDLEYALATGKKFAEGKAKTEYDAKANDLKAQRDELKAQYDKLFNPPEKTNTEKQVASLTKKLTDLQQKADTGDLSTPGATQGPDVKPVADLKQQIRDVQKQLADARAADFDRQVKGATTALERAIEQNQKKLEAAQRGEFAKREAAEPLKTEALNALRDRNKALTDQIDHLRDTNEAYQNSLKTDRLKAQSEDLLDRLRKNDIALNPNRETPDTPEQARVRAANQMLRQHLEDLREAAGVYDPQRVEAATKAVTKSIERYQKLLRGEEVPGKPESKTPKTPELEALRQLRDDLQAKAGEQKRQEDLQRQITELDAKIRNSEFGKTQGPPEAKTKLEQERDRLRKLFQQGQRKAEGLRKSPAEMALQAAKVRAANSIADSATKLMRGEFQAPPKRITVFSDPELSRLQAEQARWRQRYQNGLRQWQDKQRPLWAKAINVAGQIPRAGLLTGYTTLIKLPMASFWNLATKIPTEIAGTAFSKLPGTAQIFAKAPTEGGGFSPKAYGRAVAHAATTGIKEAWKVLTSKEHQSDLSMRLKGEQISRSRIELGGILHAALKEPVKQFAFEYAMAKQAENSVKAGIDPATPGWREIAEARAFKYAEHSIFQERRSVTQAFHMAGEHLAKSTNAQGDLSVGGQVGAAVLRGTTPIVTVPTNIIAQTVEHIAGLPLGGAEAVNAWRKGIDNLKPEQADVIARHLKRGSLGAAMATLGIFAYEAFGGLYRPGHKKDEKDVTPEGVRVNDVTAPSMVTHHPAWMVAQAFATMMKVAHEQMSPKDARDKGYLKGVVAAAAGLTEGLPGVEAAQTLTQLLDEKQRDYATGKLERSVIPLGVQQAARATDKAQGMADVVKRMMGGGSEVPKRKPTGIIENLESGIPGLRQNVPEDTKSEVPKDKAEQFHKADHETAMATLERMTPEERAKKDIKTTVKVGGVTVHVMRSYFDDLRMRLNEEYVKPHADKQKINALRDRLKALP